MNIYRFEVRSLAKSVLGWLAALCGMMLVYLSMYPMFRDSGFDVSAVFEKFPYNLRALFGMDGLDPQRFTGFLPFPLKLAQELAAIGGLVVGAFAAAHDSRQKCADFLFAKPVSRTRVLWAKTGAVATASAVILLGLCAFLALIAKAMAPTEPFSAASALCSAALPAMIFFLYGAAGLLLGVLLPKVRGVAAMGLGSMFFFHIVNSVGKVATKDPAHWLVRALTPVCMFERGLAAMGRLEWAYLLLWALEAAVLLSLSFYFLRRKDIQ